jgi:hypothetical protein
MFLNDERKRLPDGVLETLAKIMEMRHIYCHEVSREPQIGIGETYLQVTDCMHFLAAAETIISLRADPSNEELAAAMTAPNKEENG